MATSECIFCGDSRMSLEHIIPKWAGEVLLRTKPPPSRPDMRVVALHTRGSTDKDAGYDREWYTKDAPNFQVRCVCEDCNNGWMSDIEEAAQPIVTAMIEDQTLTLDTENQAFVSKWLGLKAIVSQYSLPAPTIVREWTEAFARERSPPTVWQIRIGRYTGTNTMHMANTALDTTVISTLSPIAMKKPGFLFTVQVGYFVGQVLGIRQHTLVPINRRRFIQIWPHPLLRSYSPAGDGIASQSWPPERGLDDSDLTKCVKDPAEPKD